MNVYEYKGYIGSAEVDVDSSLLVGKLLFIRDSIGYSAESVKGLEEAFRQAVDDYLATCAEEGDEPEIPCKGSFNVRVDPALHRSAALKSRALGITLNQLVIQGLQLTCSGKAEHHTHLTVRVVQGPTTRIASAGIPTRWETPNGQTTTH